MTTKNGDVKNWKPHCGDWRPPRKMRLDHLLQDPLAPTLQSAPLSKGEGYLYKQIQIHKVAKHLQITM